MSTTDISTEKPRALKLVAFNPSHADNSESVELPLTWYEEELIRTYRATDIETGKYYLAMLKTLAEDFPANPVPKLRLVSSRKKPRRTKSSQK